LSGRWSYWSAGGCCGRKSRPASPVVPPPDGPPGRGAKPQQSRRLPCYNCADVWLTPPPRKATVMAQAVVDPAELRRFAFNLKRFNADLQTNLGGLHAQLLALGDTWRDQEHDRFRQDFEDTMKVVERFVEAANLHIPFLLRKAERIEEYLQQR